MRQVVESIRDRRILHEVALVQDVGSRWWDGHEEFVCVVGRELRFQRHALQEVLDLRRGEAQSRAGVDVRRVCFCVPRGEVGRDHDFAIGVNNLDGLDAARFPGLSSMSMMNVRTHTKGSSQYSENIVTMMFVTMFNFVKSVAVTSMKTFRVFRVILLRSELMMGGIESTWSSLS